MALSIAATWPIAETARFASRHVRLTVVLAVVLICGSFAAAAALSMRFDRVHALAQAGMFEERRARDIAAVVGASLDRMEQAGRAFADGEVGQRAPDGVRNIAVYAADGTPVSMFNGTTAFVRLPRGVVMQARAGRVLIADAGLATLATPWRGEVIAIAFETRALAPASLLERASVRFADGRVKVDIAPDDERALAAWYGSLPLYLFVILGPALVGAWLASLFVGEFERRARADQAVKALRATQPADAKLLVRLAQAERDAIEAQRSKAEFIAHMSHELRTPLNAVIGFSEIIEREMFGRVGHAKYLEYARDIGSAGRGLHGKIGDILEYSNLEAGRYPVAVSDFDVVELASACVDEQTGRAFSRRIALDFAPSPPAIAHADPNAVRRVITSLLANALAYTPEGGKVGVGVAVEEGAVAVHVSDTGPGFQAEEASRAGNAFRRFDRQGGRTGAGLGLAIAVALARRTGGALKLTSAAGQGTRTELRLPRTG